MRLGWTTSKYSITYRAVKTIRVNEKNKTQIIKSFGSEKYICKTYGVTDAKAWAKEQVQLMNEAEKEDSAKFYIELCAGTDLVMNEQRRLNGGYLFLQDIYYALGLHKICRAISKRHLFEYDLNDILSRLVYTRILYPSSKKVALRKQNASLSSLPSSSTIFTVLSRSLHRNRIIYKAVCSKTVPQSRSGTPRSFIMTVRTFILKQIPLKMISSLGKARKTARFRSSTWDCSWIWMVSRYHFPYIPVTGMNR